MPEEKALFLILVFNDQNLRCSRDVSACFPQNFRTMVILTQPNLKFVTALSRQNCAVRLGLSVAVPKLERALQLLKRTHSAQRTRKTQRKKYV